MFFIKVHHNPEVSKTAMFLSFLKQVTWKSPHFIFHLYNNSAMLIPQWNFQNWIPKWRSCVTYYGCSFVAKFSKWLLYSKKINFRCLGNDFLCSSKDFHIQWMIFIWWTNDFHCQKMTFTCSTNDFTFNRKFTYSAVWILCLVTWDLYSTIWDLRLTK